MKKTIAIKKFGLQDCILMKKSTSRLGGQILQLKKQNGEIVFLKSGRGIAAESLFREKNALGWLENKQLIVPKVLNFFEDKNGGTKYLLLTSLRGFAAQKVADLNKEEVLRISAVALREFHSVSMNGSNNLRTLDDDLSHIQKCLKFNLIKRKNFLKANEGKMPEDVYSYLIRMKDNFSKSVMVHGDYCLPNIMITKDGYGFIDLSDCGPGDPYKDFSAMEVSITRNFGSVWINTFYKYYGGVKKVNKFKIEYYQLIDQFGYHLDSAKYLKFFNTSVHNNEQSSYPDHIT